MPSTRAAQATALPISEAVSRSAAAGPRCRRTSKNTQPTIAASEAIIRNCDKVPNRLASASHSAACRLGRASHASAISSATIVAAIIPA